MAALAGHNVAAKVNVLDCESLLEQLDEQYAAYLQLLNQYTLAREQLAKCFSAGFLALAQANFTTQNRMRFGQDHYDQRTRALRVAAIIEREDHEYQVSIIKQQHRSLGTTVEEDSAKPQREGDKAANQQETPTPSEDENSQEVAEDLEDVRPVDPLRWFGVLVPQALRACQQHFTTAVEQAIPEVGNLDTQMKALEINIRRTKKHLSKLRD